ncbi:MAG: RibD family protein, partial [Duncaniella sp.]|nr:RibD family protein [Duncaniella sp.]
FMTAHRLRRPYITLKWAESSDGYIDGHISTPLTSMLVHRLRATNDAILVGSGTWLADSPRLDTRLYAGRSPLRVILDRRGRADVPADDHTLVYSDYNSLLDVLADLYRRGVTSLLVEGGAGVLSSFISENLWDAIRIERGAKPLGGSVKAPELSPLGRVEGTCMVDGNTIINIRR